LAPIDNWQRLHVRVSRLLAACAIAGAATASNGAAETEPRFAVLVFSKTTGYRHDSIPQGIAAIKALGADHGFAVDSTEDAARFTDAELARHKVVVFLNTTGDILGEGQKAAFERYIRSGGGFAGVHSASDTEYRWAWYGRLVGAYFADHPEIQPATVHIEDRTHPSTNDLPAVWQRTDEWYNFRSNPRGAVHVLATLDEATYSGGKMGNDHPIAWCQAIDGGRSWYTAMGHTSESYAEPLYRLHLLGGIESAAGVAGGCPR
jgi:cytochrome c